MITSTAIFIRRAISSNSTSWLVLK